MTLDEALGELIKRRRNLPYRPAIISTRFERGYEAGSEFTPEWADAEFIVQWRDSDGNTQVWSQYLDERTFPHLIERLIAIGSGH